ncbi:MAG: CheR family methyltransferase, partial [Marinobacter sp.]|nr:CheR family methyltransferase [Marinobacter sp.]
MNKSTFSYYVSELEDLRPHIREICRISAENRADIRVWAAGCSTGEKAYALAILFSQTLAGEEHPPAVQVFATDIDEQALAVARQGWYPDEALQNLSTELLDRYFLKLDQGYKVNTQLR